MSAARATYVPVEDQLRVTKGGSEGAEGARVLQLALFVGCQQNPTRWELRVCEGLALFATPVGLGMSAPASLGCTCICLVV